MNSRSLGLAVALAVSIGAMAQPTVAPDASLANPLEKQVHNLAHDYIDRVPGSGSGDQLAIFIAQPGTHEVGLAFRMLSMTNAKVAFKPAILQALDLPRTD